jgi:hypothetical protein
MLDDQASPGFLFKLRVRGEAMETETERAGDPAGAAAERLAAALERIAEAARRRRDTGVAPGPEGDAIIAELRAALADKGD